MRLLNAASRLLRSALARAGLLLPAPKPTRRPCGDSVPFDPEETLAAIRAATNPSRALWILYGRLDRAMRDGEFEKMDALLRRAAAEDIDLDVAVGMLSGTLPARGKLPSYQPLYARTLARLIEADGESNARDCLRGLEPLEPDVR